MVNQFVVELRRKSLVVDEDDICSFENANNALLFQEITSNKMRFSRRDTPKAAARLEFCLLEVRQVTSIIHHFTTPALTTNFESCLENNISNAGTKVNENLARLELCFLEDGADESREKFAIDIVRAILILSERLNPRRDCACIRLNENALYPGQPNSLRCIQLLRNSATDPQTLNSLVIIVHCISKLCL